MSATTLDGFQYNTTGTHRLLVPDSSVTAQDVLLGRGASADRFQGNVRFRALVRTCKDAYQGAMQHHDKAALAQQVVDAVYAYGGRFLRKVNPVDYGLNDESQVAWEIVDNAVAVEKVKQALRDIQQGGVIRSAVTSHRKPAPSQSLRDGSGPREAAIPTRASGRSEEGSVPLRTSNGSQKKASRSAQQPSRQREGSKSRQAPESIVAAAMKQIALSSAAPSTNPTESRSASTMAIPRTPHALSQGIDCSMGVSQHVRDYLERNATAVAGSMLVDRKLIAASVEFPPMRHGSGAVNAARSQYGPLLSETVRDEVAFSWREIPGAYLDFLPQVKEGRIRPFCSEDLQIILLTLSWAEAARDCPRLGLIRTVIYTILELPARQLQLTRPEMESLMSAAQSL